MPDPIAWSECRREPRGDDRIDGSDPPDGRPRVNANAVQPGAGAGLIALDFHALAPRLQSLLARHGVALADYPPSRLRQLGDRFTGVPAFGLWYYSDTEVADLVSDLVARALGA